MQLDTSFKPSSAYMGQQENKIIKDNVNYFQYIFVNETVDGRQLDQHLDLKDFSELTKNNRNGTSADDSVLFCREMHGFPLFYLHAVDAEMKPAYLKPPRSEFTSPLHIDTNKTKYNDLIPIFDSQKAEKYKEKLKVYFYSLLFEVIKFDETNNNYKFVYLRAYNDEQTECIYGGYLLFDELEKSIYSMNGDITIFEYLKSRYMRDGNFGKWRGVGNKFDILNDNGKLKLYHCLRYQENLIRQELQERKKQLTEENRQINPAKINSIFLHIITEELRRIREQYSDIITSSKEPFDNFDENSNDNSKWEAVRQKFNKLILLETEYETGEVLKKKIKMLLTADDFIA
jgi:hypothetical protein